MISISITQVRNAKALNADYTRFDVEINHPDHGWIPYTLDPSDTDNTVDNEALLALIGSDFAAYVAPTTADLAADVRADRDGLLAASDVYATADRITDPWRTYRQALRDLPAQAGFPTNVTWPTEPS